MNENRKNMFDGNDQGIHEQTFYVRCSLHDDPKAISKYVVKGPCEIDVTIALLNDGYKVESIIEASTPPEKDFSDRLDGTILVAASHKARKLEVWGPFNDEADAQAWMSIRTTEPGLVYTVIDPDDAIRVEVNNGEPKIVRFPPGLFNGKL